MAEEYSFFITYTEGVGDDLLWFVFNCWYPQTIIKASLFLKDNHKLHWHRNGMQLKHNYYRHSNDREIYQ